MLEIKATKKLGDLHLNVDIQVPTLGITGIFGESGCGKTSLINLVAGLLKPDSGRIILNDRVLVDCQGGIFLKPHHRHMGYVFQDARLFPHYNVKGNLCYGVKKFQQTQFDQIVQLLGIGSLLNRSPETLSGGEKQRVAIGRALLSDPELLLMDEPLSALDEGRKAELLRYLEQLTREIHIPILYVTHSREELKRLSDRVVVMTEGTIKHFGIFAEMTSFI